VATVDELLKRITDLEKRLEESEREKAGLREENAKLRRVVEEWKRGHRERSKRRTSRAEGARVGERKKPGRKVGHAPARRAVPKPDRTVNHPLPPQCGCGGHVVSTGEVASTIVQDIPPVRVENVEHVAPVGRCKTCGKRVVAPLPGAVAGGQSIASVQLGPNAHALILDLRYVVRTPLRAIAGFVGRWFGLSISAGGLSQLIDRLRIRSEPSYREIVVRLRQELVVGIDETGLRQQGATGWAWLARTPRVSLFRIEPSRGSWVAESMLGGDFGGIVVSDFYGVYTANPEWDHGYCGAHVIREVKKIAEVHPTPETESFRDDIRAWYERAVTAPLASVSTQRRRVQELSTLLDTWKGSLHCDIQRLRLRLDTHFIGVTRFVSNPAVPPDNNATERDIRCLAAFRKITGGTRSINGALSLGHWMSITQTLRKNDVALSPYIAGVCDAHLHGREPPSVFLTS
jgi:transposase